jgi:cellulose synthase/poly-beta-1,6-N-acetylglucosamine synthase-like glycosyltransferase
MSFLPYLINTIEIIALAYFGFAAVYLFIFALAGKIGYRYKTKEESTHRKIAVLIPGYKEDAVIVDVAKDAIQQNYPKEFFDVVVIADSFQPATISQLKALPIKLVEVEFVKSTKSKALNRAMEVIGDLYDIALILDADNIMEKDFLRKINNSFGRGFLTVQGHRVAKNLNTNMAILDAISEEVNNHIYRLGHRALGFSSALIGSGMAFEYSFFKNTMKEVNAVGGFDKELELRLLKDRKKIDYLNHALVYDEKVQNTEVFQNQRKRWLSAQFVYFGRYFFPGIIALFTKGNIDFMDKVYQMVQPPRVLQLGIITFATGLWAIFDLIPWTWIQDVSIFGSLYWYMAFALTFLAFVLAIPTKFYNKNTLKAVLALPGTFFIMLLSLFKLKGANKKFIHTEHGTDN